MYLGGQGNQRGYAMAALLVSIGVMLVLMSVAMPVWRHEAQREKEAELVFRGEQYARAVNLYQRKMGPGNFPPNVDVLVQQHFLRKKYKDPITNADFQLIPVGGGVPGPGQTAQQSGGRGRGGAPLTGPTQPQSPSQFQPGRFGGQGQGTAGQFGEGGRGVAGIMGVMSKSKEPSILAYHGATHYNEWAFLFSNVSNRPGGPGGRGAPGIPGGRRGGNPGDNSGRNPGRNPGGPPSLGTPGLGNPGGLGRPGGGRGGGPGGPGPGR
jgi:type II secretory pathway pseudopilin PulG